MQTQILQGTNFRQDSQHLCSALQISELKLKTDTKIPGEGWCCFNGWESLGDSSVFPMDILIYRGHQEWGWGAALFWTVNMGVLIGFYGVLLWGWHDVTCDWYSTWDTVLYTNVGDRYPHKLVTKEEVCPLVAGLGTPWGLDVDPASWT